MPDDLKERLKSLETANKQLSDELNICEEEALMAEEQCINDAKSIKALEAERDAMKSAYETILELDPEDLVCGEALLLIGIQATIRQALITAHHNTS